MVSSLDMWMVCFTAICGGLCSSRGVQAARRRRMTQSVNASVCKRHPFVNAAVCHPTADFLQIQTKATNPDQDSGKEASFKTNTKGNISVFPPRSSFAAKRSRASLGHAQFSLSNSTRRTRHRNKSQCKSIGLSAVKKRKFPRRQLETAMNYSK